MNLLPPFVQNNIPLLVVLAPLLASPLIVLFQNRTIAFLFAMLAAGISFILSLAMLGMVMDGSTLSYHIGGWIPPLGIEYRVDAASAFVLVLVSMIAFIMMPYAHKSIDVEIDRRHHTLFYASFMLCFCGLMGITITGDAFNVFVFLEISSLSTYALVALGAKRDRRALSAAYDYLILGTIGATFFVIGLGFIYMATGTLNMVDLAERLSALEDNRTVRSGVAFIVIGLGLKLAMFPMHRWLPGAYTYAPSAISVFLAATATKVALFVVMRFLFNVFTADFDFERDLLEFIVMPLAITAMFVGSLIAIYQADFKRLLAFSSIAQIGYMLLGMCLLNIEGVSASLLHMFNHGITKGALFMAAGALLYRNKDVLVAQMAGLGKRMPLTAAAIGIGLLSLIGVPGTAGFVSKWVLLNATLEKGWWPVTALIVMSSLVTVFYSWRLMEIMYLQPAPEGAAKKEAPLALLLPLWILTIATIWFGLQGNLTISAATAGAESLLNGGFLTDTPIIVGTPGR
ncbi:MAG: monovalent cation/H+ antiporter subunit D family protein [Pseudomonadota bacterium]